MLQFPAAIFSDVHANLEALEAVLADMDALSIRSRVCLGDTVGYGPDPGGCLQRVRSLNCPTLMGNHDDATAGDGDLSDMGAVAVSGILFAREKLSPEERAYLKSLPLTFSAENSEFVHASLDAPSEWNYILSVWDAVAHFAAQTKPLCFCGHTHVPAAWHLTDDGDIAAWPGQGRIQAPPGGKLLVNVGSVGQPRDLQPSACYVICDEGGRSIEFRRVKYDIAKTRKKILRAKLPPFSAERLSLGR
jgi:diadenosine tetraphosphatase ApaH/serine/threonine PP2A family protein phosphatase